LGRLSQGMRHQAGESHEPAHRTRTVSRRRHGCDDHSYLPWPPAALRRSSHMSDSTNAAVAPRTPGDGPWTLVGAKVFTLANLGTFGTTPVLRMPEGRCGTRSGSAINRERTDSGSYKVPEAVDHGPFVRGRRGQPRQ
jgi:hypothetical protein